jgi:hypothetical protein
MPRQSAASARVPAFEMPPPDPPEHLWLAARILRAKTDGDRAALRHAITIVTVL